VVDKEKCAVDDKTNMRPRHRDTACALNWMRISMAYYMMRLHIAQGAGKFSTEKVEVSSLSSC